jgi:hypothetical protein
LQAFTKELRESEGRISAPLLALQFCRIHSALRMAPALAVGIADHVWAFGELIA